MRVASVWRVWSIITTVYSSFRLSCFYDPALPGRSARATTKQILSNNRVGALSSKKVANAEGGGLSDRHYRSEHAGDKDEAKARMVLGELQTETAGLRRSSLNQSPGRGHRRG